MVNAYPEWRRLEELLGAISCQGIEHLAADEILEFGKWYRRAAAELSFHRTHEADPEQLAYLNGLVGRCYPFVYTAPRRPRPQVRHFFAADFPRAFRRHGLFILLAFLLSIIPAALGFAIAWHDRAVADQVIAPQLMQGSDYVAQRHHTRQDWMPAQERAETSGFIITNNIHVSILAFAGGMTAGLLTIFEMIYNGLMLGVGAAVVLQDGPATALNFWSFVAPHGVFELTAIFISGGAGLLLAYALVNPGELPRRVALREAGKEALTLMLGVAAMLVIAGLFESFFSPLNIPEEIKLTTASVEAVLLFGYLLLAGRKRVKSEV
jgi:uncharacterized membrane protein SpoIIM required for sporulation